MISPSALSILCFLLWNGDSVSGFQTAALAPFSRTHRALPQTVTSTQVKSQTTALGYANNAPNADLASSLIGQVLMGEYKVFSNIPVASAKCKIYEAHRIKDPQKTPLIVKLSPMVDHILMEYKKYEAVGEKLGSVTKRLNFVEKFDWIEPCPTTQGWAGFVMEKGDENLRFDIMRGKYTGRKLQKAIESVIRIVGSLHDAGIVWTEIKAENFVVQENGTIIKGIDLESAIWQNELLAMYTAEACPPEFPVEDMYKCLPQIRTLPSFDMWGLGMCLFELATGRPFYKDGLTDLEYIKDKLRNPQKMISYMNHQLKINHVDPMIVDIVRGCLTIDPARRSSCAELLQSPYFKQQIPEDEPTTIAPINGIPQAGSVGKIKPLKPIQRSTVAQKSVQPNSKMTKNFGAPKLPEKKEAIQMEPMESIETFCIPQQAISSYWERVSQSPPASKTEILKSDDLVGQVLEMQKRFQMFDAQRADLLQQVADLEYQLSCTDVDDVELREELSNAIDEVKGFLNSTQRQEEKINYSDAPKEQGK